MRRRSRLGFSSLAALGLSLVLAGSVAAASTSTVVNKNVCQTWGGLYGYGKVVLQVTATEYGLSGVNKIKFVSYLKYSPTSSGPWFVAGSGGKTTPYHANTSANTSYWYKVRYDFVRSDRPWFWRLEIVVKFLDRYGTYSTVHTDRVIGRSCSP